MDDWKRLFPFLGMSITQDAWPSSEAERNDQAGQGWEAVVIKTAGEFFPTTHAYARVRA